MDVFVIKLDSWTKSRLFWLFWPGKIVYLPLPGNDPKQRRPNITRAQKLLDWQPKAMKKGKNSGTLNFSCTSLCMITAKKRKVELREGLQKTIEYFKAGFQCESKGRSGD